MRGRGGRRSAALRVRRLHAAAAKDATPRVLVVGGGPVGLAMGYLLDRVYDVPTRIVEKQATPTTHPQAHFLNLRTMEVLHAAMPAFHDRLLDQAAPSELWRDYIYTTGVGRAREFARIDQFGANIPRPLESKQQLLDALSGLSPTQFVHFPQNRFETMLSEFVDESGLRVERQVELVGLTNRGDKGPVDVQLRCLRSQRVEDASFDYVIGADGAHSLVRQLSGIDMVGTRNLQSIVNVHFTSKALSLAPRENPAMLYFVFNENVIGVLIAHDLSRGEWVFQIPFFPPQESIAQDFSVAQCQDIVRHLLPAGEPVDDISILSVGQWQMSARVAKQYDADRRVFLVGDAAHQFPPAGGFGMNTGVQDAHNLAWKLAWAIQTERGELPVNAAALLRSYEHERQLVAKLNTQLSLRNVERTMKIPSALNVSHNNAKLLEAIVNAAPVKFLPLALQREAIQRIMTLGKKPLGLLDSASSALGERMRRHVRAIVAQRASLGMLFYHFDIGFSYDTTHWGQRAKQLLRDDALNVSAQFALPSDATTSSAVTVSDDVFVPKFAVGARFPHLWCVAARSDRPTRVSTVALEALVRAQSPEHRQAVRFALVVDANQWTGKPQSSTAESEDDDVWRHVAVVAVHGQQNDEVRGDHKAAVVLRVDGAASSALWTQFTSSHAAALVRPDGHVAALFARGSVIDAAALRAAMQAV